MPGTSGLEVWQIKGGSFVASPRRRCVQRLNVEPGQRGLPNGSGGFRQNGKGGRYGQIFSICSRMSGYTKMSTETNMHTERINQ